MAPITKPFDDGRSVPPRGVVEAQGASGSTSSGLRREVSRDAEGLSGPLGSRPATGIGQLAVADPMMTFEPPQRPSEKAA